MLKLTKTQVREFVRLADHGFAVGMEGDWSTIRKPGGKSVSIPEVMEKAPSLKQIPEGYIFYTN